MTGQLQPTTRNVAFDIIRVIACVMVVTMHSPLPGDTASNHGMLLSALSFLTAPCIGLFFMVSGALLLDSKSALAGPQGFMRRRLSRVALPTLIWSAIYLIINNINQRGVLRAVASIPFSAQGYGTMWFMYTLIGLYLLTPILAAWLQRASRSAVEFYLIAWAISLCYPFMGKYLEINTSNTGILYYFSGYAGYYVLGWYFKHNPRRFSLRLLTALSLGFIILKGADKVFELGFDDRDAFWYLSIAVATMCISWWMICTRFAETTLCKSNNIFIKALRLVSDYSFGIYLCHILIMRFWLWKSPWIQSISSYLAQTSVIAIATFVFSLILCIALSKLPMGQYIVGYKKR